MALITSIILPQNYEYVRDRIAEILFDEMHNQMILSGDYDVDVDVFVERSTPFTKIDLPALNVTIDAGTWDSKHQGSSRGTYIFNIDCVTSAPATQAQGGDVTSAIKATRLAGIVRAILENPIYKTLGFTPPFISRTACASIQFGKPSGADANNDQVARITFTCVVNETTELIIPTLAAGFDTTWRVNNTAQGYQITTENY